MVLEPWDERPTPETQIQAIMASLNPELPQIEEAMSSPSGRRRSRAWAPPAVSRSSSRIAAASGLELLQHVADDLVDQGRQATRC